MRLSDARHADTIDLRLSYTNRQISECSRCVLLIILLSDFRIINVLVLPTNQKPLLQGTQVTRSALSPLNVLWELSSPVASFVRVQLYSVFGIVALREVVLLMSLCRMYLAKNSFKYHSVHCCSPCIDTVFCTWTENCLLWISNVSLERISS